MRDGEGECDRGSEGKRKGHAKEEATVAHVSDFAVDRPRLPLLDLADDGTVEGKTGPRTPLRLLRRDQAAEFVHLLRRQAGESHAVQDAPRTLRARDFPGDLSLDGETPTFGE